MKHSNFNVRSGQERIAMNSPIQGTAADIIKIAMIRVNDALKQGNFKSRLLLQIHDELLVEAHLSEVEEVKALMKQEMEAACELLVPLTAEVNAGSDWYEAK
jgi:DNA polymerase-1